MKVHRRTNSAALDRMHFLAVQYLCCAAFSVGFLPRRDDVSDKEVAVLPKKVESVCIVEKILEGVFQSWVIYEVHKCFYLEQ